MKLLKCFMLIILTLSLLLNVITVLAEENGSDSGTPVESAGTSPDFIVHDPLEFSNVKYRDYLSQFSNTVYPSERVIVKASDYSNESGSSVVLGDYEGRDNVLLWESQEGYVEWVFNVHTAGLYNIGIEYCPIPGRNTDIEIGISINDRILFEGAERFELNRTWRNETNEFSTDGRGNELRPRQNEVFIWDIMPIMDSHGLENDPFYFYFEQGENKIRLQMINEVIAIDSIHLYQHPKQQSYVRPVVESDLSGILEIFQAEFTDLKSSAILYPTEERGDPAIMSSHPFLVRYNTIGRNTFMHPKQWITWQIEVPAAGYYNIAFKVRQNAQRGMFSSRRIYINGDVPFDEMNKIEFPFGIRWYTQVLGSDQPYLFYLDEGLNEIKMEVVTGDIAGPLRELEEILFELNTWYRKIIMITGSNPDSSRQTIDVNRDFLLDQKIPGLIEGFEDLIIRLGQVKATIDKISFEDGNTASFIDEIILQLEQFVRRPDTIPRRIDHYKGNVSSLSYTILQMREQPLEIDYIAVFSPDMINDLPSDRAGFFQNMAFRLRMFISSFVEDYSSVGEIYDTDPINVWVSTSEIAMTGISSGRDQAQVIKSLIDDLFVPQTGIGVNLSLVNSGEALIQAVLAGQGPDAAMFIPKELPVNLAVRGALANLDRYEDFEEVTQRFFESAMIPYYFQGKAYALPETQNFEMMFIRTDIFDELGLEIPTTWDEFYAVAALLNINNMMVGILENIRTFEMFIFQNNASFYNDNLTRTGFDQPEALQAFRDWTGLYAKHSLPLVFDFFSRFRTGEMPISIMPYTQVNWLTAAAPEIRNLWVIAPIPGKVQPDGTINNSSTATGTASIVINNSGREDESYEFIKWWTSNEVQSRFGNDLEQLMGPSARYPTANVEAFKMLPWSRRDSENLMRQWENVRDIPQVPGNYYITRNISFAFRSVVFNHENERETLNKYNRAMNKEIERKRIEFGLDVD